VLVGIGSPDRGDDAIGPAVVGLVAEWVAGGSLGVSTPGRRPFVLPAGTQVLSRSDPSRLIEAITGADLAVIVDAVLTGAPAGTVHVLEMGADQPAPSVDPPAPDQQPPPGTHGMGVADALALARILGRLPPRVVVVGVEGRQFTLGAPPTDAVREALLPAARAALHALGHDDPISVAELPALMPHPATGLFPWPPDRPPTPGSPPRS
jgi:hydrogenase maturation protease